MIDAAKLAAAMEENLIRRADSGPTADPPLEGRTVPRVSTLSMGCARRAAYWLVGTPEPPRTAALSAASQMGTELEAGVLDDFEAALGSRVVSKERQVKIRTEWMAGSADEVLVLDTGEKIVADSKCMNRDAFEIRGREGASEHHVSQLSQYAEGVGGTLLAILERNSDARGLRGKPSPGVYRVTILPPSAEAVAKAKAISLRAMQARDAGDPEIAPRAYTADNWICRYCPHTKRCHG